MSELRFQRYRKRPIVVQAAQVSEAMWIRTLEGVMLGKPGDWLIIGVAGERYPCKPDIFEETYELVEDDEPQGGTINRNDLLASPDEGRIRIETQQRLDEVRRQNDRGVHELFRGPDGPDPLREALTREAELEEESADD
ncbi:MAG TPA: hypothetical protein VM537_32535 [Anaerolineae bacterium]|nr:hypothetical protein [Anaerolineae bacterium]